MSEIEYTPLELLEQLKNDDSWESDPAEREQIVAMLISLIRDA
jgi:hypothetical protein